MSHFGQYITSRLSFDNGYNVSYDSVPSVGQISISVWHKGDRVDVGQFMTEPAKSDGFFAYVTPEEFAKVIYRVSGEKLEK